MAPTALLRKLPLLASILLLATASPLLPSQNEELVAPAPQSIQRRQGASTPVTGITVFGVQPRLEIRQLEQNVDQWNVYLLGLVRFHQANQSDQLSYYQIAGGSVDRCKSRRKHR